MVGYMMANGKKPEKNKAHEHGEEHKDDKHHNKKKKK